jgi:hypothetical protein
MMPIEDYRRKAADWLSKAQSASDPMTAASMRRASDAWAALAQQVERDANSPPQSSIRALRPADLAMPRDLQHPESIGIGDVLRGRLHLGEDLD